MPEEPTPDPESTPGEGLTPKELCPEHDANENP